MIRFINGFLQSALAVPKSLVGVGSSLVPFLRARVFNLGNLVIAIASFWFLVSSTEIDDPKLKQGDQKANIKNDTEHEPYEKVIYIHPTHPLELQKYGC